MTYVIFLTVAVIIFCYVYNRRTKQARKDFAKYQLYAARDRFVSLVAEGHLSERELVFTYFHKRIDEIISIGSEVGLDDVLEKILNGKNSRKFKETMARSESTWSKLLECKSMRDKKVQAAVNSYLVGVEKLLLANSSSVRMTWFVTKHFTNRFIVEIIKVLPAKGELFNRRTSHAAEILRKIDEHRIKVSHASGSTAC